MADEKKPATIKHKKNRLEAFSDGVFAIAITLMVLDIAIPAENATAPTCLVGSRTSGPSISRTSSRS